MAKKPQPRERRRREYKGEDGSGLIFAEYDDDYEVIARDADGHETTLRLSKGEARTFGRFLKIRR